MTKPCFPFRQDYYFRMHTSHWEYDLRTEENINWIIILHYPIFLLRSKLVENLTSCKTVTVKGKRISTKVDCTAQAFINTKVIGGCYEIPVN